MESRRNLQRVIKVTFNGMRSRQLFLAERTGEADVKEGPKKKQQQQQQQTAYGRRSFLCDLN
ncbi:hypothetical protein MGG_16882 [Pyricularia oryzae 70-15]|uniref:Uncharacterized protein n=4 Tax=Pyricularia oryzae TaxID=318829 RepID=G4N524_PYRO7|nr:uncharacterized protein MGG_16882 [Pyricularia oryzae 70-15]ELQ39056.1 hypothetical protein OOU_Y34scaffold00516g91 [Pyricularia oryzae Y34]KAI6264298.1 hypothetical protein MCOR26_011444 [Pyricularia oryzae]EHA52935.1 hypothetical protein MGG_16882 [Pyricularia oryzae 70-15]KAI6274203.1 hypothetical protein MCOR34_011521 [Pyricularia oryzae]KAI6392617.1 hypothetical protein MCOR23_008374 [Pyricularia oryzae]